MPAPNSDFREVWWIYSPINNKEWGGLRLAIFRKSVEGVLLCVIQGEIDKNRVGVRDWDTLQATEHWYKVEQVQIPDMIKIMAAAIDDDHAVH